MTGLGFIKCVARSFELWHGIRPSVSSLRKIEDDLKLYGIISEEGKVVDLKEALRYFSLPVEELSGDLDTLNKNKIIEFYVYESLKKQQVIYILGDNKGGFDPFTIPKGFDPSKEQWRSRYVFRIFYN